MLVRFAIVRAITFSHAGVAEVFGAIPAVIEHSLGPGERSFFDRRRRTVAKFANHGTTSTLGAP